MGHESRETLLLVNREDLILDGLVSGLLPSGDQGLVDPRSRNVAEFRQRGQLGLEFLVARSRPGRLGRQLNHPRPASLVLLLALFVVLPENAGIESAILALSYGDLSTPGLNVLAV